MLAVDLGGRTTKAVHVQRRGQGFALCGYALLDAPIFDKTLSADLLTEHLKAVAQALEAKTKAVTLTLGVNDALVRHTEMPRLPADDMRLVLKHSSRTYLQQDLANHVFDCHVLAAAVARPTGQTGGIPQGAPLARKSRKSSSPAPGSNSLMILSKAPGARAWWPTASCRA